MCDKQNILSDEESKKITINIIDQLTKNYNIPIDYNTLNAVKFDNLSVKYKQLFINYLISNTNNKVDINIIDEIFQYGTNNEHIFETLKLSIQICDIEYVNMLCDILYFINYNLSINWSILLYEAKNCGNAEIFRRITHEDIKCQIGATNNSDQNVKEVSKAANIDNIATQF